MRCGAMRCIAVPCGAVRSNLSGVNEAEESVSRYETTRRVLMFDVIDVLSQSIIAFQLLVNYA